MDEAGGCAGLIAIVLVIVVGVVIWISSRSAPAPVRDGVGVGVAAAAVDDPPKLFDSWPLGRPASLGLFGVLYLGGLFLIRPRAIRAKRNGATDQQAALIALTSFALSPVVVPVTLVWHGLGALGRALTIDPGPESKPRPPRGANDLD
jgi:hypothetical protein